MSQRFNFYQFFPKKKEILAFFDFWEKEKKRKLELILLILFFLIFPNQNAYQALQIQKGRPLIREVNFSLPDLHLLPIKKNNQNSPSLTAKAAVVVDLPSKTLIFAKNQNLRLAPASTIKLMTALVALDYYRPEDVLTVQTEWKIGQTIGFKKGERLTFKNLLYAMLIGSGNDAAYILAENYPGGVKNFVEQMNFKGKSLNLNDTYFTNPAGIDDFEQKTTVHDLAILTAEALKNPLIVGIVATPRIIITDETKEKSYSLENTNKLLGQLSGIRGVKTGWTEEAGECLIAYSQKENKELISVILGSKDRFGETRKLLEWVEENFIWENPLANYQSPLEHSQ